MACGASGGSGVRSPLVKRIFAFLALSVTVVAACASAKPGRTKLADGSYQLTCRRSLADCLTELTDVCSLHGYDIVKGKETVSRNGVEPVDSEIIESEAIIRCRTASTIFGGSAAPAGSSAPAAAAAAQRCFPGTTQACLGPGACQGAQTCNADGAMFGPCDCGAHAAPGVGNPESDAGPPPTWAVPSGDAGAP